MKDYTGLRCEELYAVVSARQKAALSMHCDLIALYDFLALEGFKELQEKQYKSESKEHIKLIEHFIETHDRLIYVDSAEQHKEYVKVIPTDWHKYTRFDVTPQARKKQIVDSFTLWLDWERETKEILCGVAAEMLKQGYIADYDFIVKYIVDVSEEIKEITSLILELKAVEYDEVYLQELQK